VIASVSFRNFKALRNACVRLAPFNLVLGPNGSGKTSLIESLLHLRALAKLPPLAPDAPPAKPDRAEFTFEFLPPHDALRVHLSCIAAEMCDALRLSPPGAPGWETLQKDIARIRSYVFDYAAMAQPSPLRETMELAPNGADLASFIVSLRQRDPAAHAWLVAEVLRLFPEYCGLNVETRADGRCVIALTLVGEVGAVTGENLSQGTLHMLALLALAASPVQPSILCIEEIDRGVHPRMLREVRDALYRVAYPDAFGLARRPAQVIATTHSPYFLDLLREHPEEVVLTQKHGREARFERLADRADVAEILQEGSLGDLWFSGILGGVPEEKP
jgi:predicted ATPase